MKVAVYDITGAKKEDKVVSDKVFGQETNKALISEVIVHLQSNLRQGTAKTKCRGEISGGGKKPWKQKGTGRARTGSIRNPLWRGGGTVFGPTGEQNWFKNIPSKKRSGAMINALSTLAAEGQVIVLSGLDMAVPKTHDLAAALMAINATGKILLVLPEKNEAIAKSGKNIPNVKVAVWNNINALDVVQASMVVMVSGAEDKAEGLVK